MRNVCESDNDYCLYLDDLPMIDLELLSKSASASDISGTRLMEKCRKIASIEVARDFINTFLGKVEFGSVIESEIHGSFLDETPQYTEIAEGTYYVKEVRQRCDEPFMGVRLDYIEVFAQGESLCEEITIWNGYDEIKKEVTIRRGLNRIQLDLVGQVFYIILSGENISWQITESNYCEASTCGCCYEMSDFESTDLTEETRVSTTKRPMRVSLSCVCLQEEIVCRYSGQLALAMAYKTAACIMENVLTSRRDNPLVRASKEDAKDTIAMLLGGADSEGTETKKEESKYWPEIWAVQRQVKPSLKGSRCVKCRGLKIVSAH